MKTSDIAIIGDGGWGTTLALHLARHGKSSRIWGAFPTYLAEVERTRENRKFLPGVPIPEQVTFDSNLDHCIEASQAVILAVPSQFLRGVLCKIRARHLRQRMWLSVSKGIEQKSHALLSQVIHQVLGRVPLAVLSGPTIAREVARDMPTAVVVASRSPELRTHFRHLMNSDHFTVYESSDTIGVELGGAVKNVIAIAAGIVDGLGFGVNTKSVLIARGIAEIARLGGSMGAKRETFMGLSGLGDLATTCFSIHSRNHGCGVEIGKGEPLRSILKNTEMIIEGIDTAQSVHALSRRYRVAMPIVQSVYEILYQKKRARSAIEALMHKKIFRETD